MNIKPKMEITEEQFAKYVAVQYSGVTNMFDIRTVHNISGLQRETIMEIMKQYEELEKKYPNVISKFSARINN